MVQSTVMTVMLIVVCVCSSICCSIIPMMYYIFQRCKGHPMNLVAIICLLELISNYNFLIIALDTFRFEKETGLERVFETLTFHTIQTNPTTFCEINDGFFVLIETLIVCFNLFFAVDLLITLRMPFYSGAKRQKMYNVLSVLGTAVLFGVMMVGVDIIKQCEPTEDSFQGYYFPDIMVYMMSVFVFVAICIIVYSTIVLKGKKSQNNTRELYIVHHRRVLIALTVFWVFPCLNNNRRLKQRIDQSLGEAAQVLQYISFFCMMLTGTFVNLARLSEPHVKANFFDLLRNIRTICANRRFPEVDAQQTKQQTKQDRRQQQSEAWNIPLSTALSEFNNQSVLQNIIQTVLELSQNTSIDQLSKTFKMSESQADRLLDQLTKESISEVGRMKKELELYCVDYGDDIQSNKRKTVFRQIGVSVSNADKESRNAADGKLITQQSQNQGTTKAIKIKATALSYYIFERIRQLSNITYTQLERSLDVANNYLSIKETRESLGASGSFFFFSYDKKFVIKTIDQQDVSSLIELLPSYYLHLLHQPNSILARIFGLYTIQIASISRITFLLMQNAFETFDTLNLKYRQYDMKGSTVSREVKNPNAPVLKDVNFLKGDEAFIFVTKDEKIQLIRQIEKDISILASLNIMDYSLLLGVADIPDQPPNFQPGRYNWKYISSCRRLSGKIFSLSLIDYLQKFNCQKLMELKYKTFLSTKTTEVSCVNTKEYYDRFLRFMDSIIVVVN